MIRRSVPLLCMVFLSLAACRKQEDAPPAEEPAAGAEAGTPAAEMENYEKGADARLADLTSKIQSLSDRAEATAAYPKEEVRQVVGELQEKRTTAQLAMDELKSSTGAGWNDIKARVDEALGDLAGTYERAAARFP